MKSVLIVSSGEKMSDFFREMLLQTSYDEPIRVSSGGEARRMTLERSFDLCIVNSPLSDELGDKLAIHLIGDRVNQVILVAKQEYADEIAEKVEEYGVFTVEKPINRATFWTAVKMAEAAFRRLNSVKNENSELKRKLEDMKFVSRAKCLLIEKVRLSESQAHDFIINEAMNSRKTRGEVAREIIRKYDN